MASATFSTTFCAKIDISVILISVLAHKVMYKFLEDAMGRSHITQKQKLTTGYTQHSVLYVLSLLSLHQSSGRKRRFFIAGVMTTLGIVSPYPYQTHIQIKNTYSTSRSQLLPDTKPETSILKSAPFEFAVTSICVVICFLRDSPLRRSPARALSLYMHSHNIRGSPSFAL